MEVDPHRVVADWLGLRSLLVDHPEVQGKGALGHSLLGVGAILGDRTCHLDLKRVEGELHCPEGVLPYILTVGASRASGLPEGTRMECTRRGVVRPGGNCNLMTEGIRVLTL